MPATISPVEAHRRLSVDPTAELIDVRTPAEYASEHAVGASCVPLDQLDPATFLREHARPDGGTYYLLCQRGKRATLAAEKLAAAGCKNAVVVEGGTMAWVAAALPSEATGRAMISLERQVRIAAGALVVLGAVLAWFVQPLFVWLSTFVGAGLVFAGITDTCGMGLLLARMPWNRAR